MTTTGNLKRYQKDATYVNIKPQDIDSLADDLGKVTLGLRGPSPATGQVTLQRQDRVKDKDENKEKLTSSEPIYANCRGPENGIPNSNKYFVTDFEAQRQMRQVPAGSKRGPLDQNMPDAEKYQRPQHVDQQRFDMMQRNAAPVFGATPLIRNAQEDDERLYVNYNMANQPAQGNNYENLRGFPQAGTSSANRKPAFEPRYSPFGAALATESNSWNEFWLNDLVLNGPSSCTQTSAQANTLSYMRGGGSCSTVSTVPANTDYPHKTYAPQRPSPQHLQNESLGSPSHYSNCYSTQPSPQLSASQSSSPPHIYANAAPPQPPAAPMMAQPVTTDPYRGSVISPSGSQAASSPYSTATDVSVPDDSVSFYSPQQLENGSKFDTAGSQHHTSLTKTLEDYLEDFDRNIGVTTTSCNEPTYANVTRAAPTNSDIHTTQQPFCMPPLTEDQPLPAYSYQQHMVPSHQPSPAVTVAAPVSTANKVQIPRLPNPAPPEQPKSVLVLLFPQSSKPPAPGLKNILPKPTDDGPAKDPAGSAKGKGKRGGRKKSSDAAGNSRNTQDGMRLENEDAKRMISRETDEALLKKVNGDTLLHRAIAGKKQHVILAILAAIQQRPALVPLLSMINSKEQSPLFMSVTAGMSWLTEILVKMHCDCNILCRFEICEGQVEYLSALHYASEFGDRHLKDLKAILTSANVNVDTLSRSGMTALHLALWKHGQIDGKTKKQIDSQKVIKELLDSGANCSIVDNKTGKSCLHFAVENGSLHITRMVLESKCHVESLIDQKNYDHRTPLHFAVSLNSISEENKIDLVKYLISKGASKNCKDKNKLTPKELVSPQHTKILELFAESMSPPRLCDDDDSLHHLLLTP